MAKIYDVVKSPIKDKIGTISRSSGYEYRDFWYKNSNGQNVHVVGWHRAIDITTLGTIIAFAKGKVISVVKGVTGQTTNPSGGNSVTLLHANGCKSVYCHLDNGSNNHLNVGDIVNEGDTLGTDVIKTTGNSTGLHLHFAIYNGSEYVDPTDYLQGKKTLVGYAENIPTPTPTPSGETIYVVVKGDTLSRIASLYGTTYQKLAEYNGIANPNLIYPGQHIRIPGSTGKVETIIYIVKSGDTLSKIAKAYNTSWQKIYADNKNVIGKNPSLIYAGQKLVIK